MDQSVASSEVVDRAARLFQFLARAQELKTPRVRSIDRYASEGWVQWLTDAPRHDAVTVAHRIDEELDDDLLVISVERLSRTPAPEPPAALDGWVSASDDPGTEPRLWEVEAGAPIDDEVPARSSSAQRPDILAAFDAWIIEWRDWADTERRDAPVRDYYERLFRIHADITGRGEEVEFVLGVGLLTWHPAGHDAVRRHVFSCPLSVTIDDHTGRIEVSIDEAARGLTFEDDMLDPKVLPERHTMEKVQHDAAGYTDHPLDHEPFAALASTLINHLDAAGRYVDDGQPRPPGDDAVITPAPALILRRRRDLGLVRALDSISEHIAATHAVPEGVLPLVDPDHVPAVTASPNPGAILDVDGDVFAPLPLNAVQRQILERVSSHAQTLVQGPPGTGKTHTAAALLSHLLAQGQRVLVTAHTDRALAEVRSKLPDQIKPLAVSVIGASRDDLADLKVAVDTISRESSDFDHDRAKHAISEALAATEQLRGERQSLGHQLVEAREAETTTHEHLGYTGTLAQIAQRFDAEVKTFSWISGLASFDGHSPAPLTSTDAAQWLTLLRSPDIAEHEHDATMRLADETQLPDPEQFARAVGARDDADAAAARVAELATHPAFAPIRSLTPQARADVEAELTALVRRMDDLQLVGTQWMADALHDIRPGQPREWTDRHAAITRRLDAVAPAIEFLGVRTSVRCPDDAGRLLAMADSLKAHLQAHGPLKLRPDGSPKTGMFAPSIIKQVADLFEQVSVNGVPPTDAQALEAFRANADARQLLDELDHAWPVSVTVPEEDTLHERASWHRGQLDQLDRVLQLAGEIQRIGSRCAEQGIPQPDWADRDQIQRHIDLIHAAHTLDRRDSAHEAYDRAGRPVADTVAWGDAAPAVHELAAAADGADTEGYARAYAHHHTLTTVRDAVCERDRLTTKMRAAAPSMMQAVLDTASDAMWDERLARLTEAWAWGNIGAWIMGREEIDTNSVQAKLTVIEQRLREKAELIAAKRAWTHAVSPDRITGSARANLTQYSQLVRKLGKGTGKYAARQRAEIRDAMDRSRGAVPVWIMPIYRIAEQFDVAENMFDVVLVDEASQAGVEATFLQYLAPKIVVIGDDKQVSPTSFINRDELHSLAGRYLYDNEHRASWQDPERSLFDEAVMRFGSRLTLREHRRCMPEIIGFSNRIAYEPDGVRLLPVRQFGADRLRPIQQIFLTDAYQEGRSKKVNRGEAKAIVDQVKTCCGDPAYDGKTIGVISLLGRDQAQYIESLLLQEIPNDEWVARDLRVGDAPDFQGSERDVIFLSMVASAQPGSRVAPLTRDIFLQRFNVAASRAKDQMWLVHSISLAQLPNSDDLRHQLVAYVEEFAGGGQPVLAQSDAVSETDRVEPFDSLFEQRVYNRIANRGYVVEPQFDANGYRIDLVVIGASARLAVECDGDHWHGPDAYRADLARQRDLERCGWTFFRIRESAFYVDEAAALAGLWSQLDELDIRPGGWVDDDGEATFEEQLDVQPPTDEHDSDEPADEEGDSSPLTAAQVATPRHAAAADAGPVAYPPALPAADPSVTSRPATQATPGAADEPAGRDALSGYREFDGTTVPVDEASRTQLIEGLVAIVEAEGPILGERLRHVYVKASGGERVGRVIASKLNKALWAAAQNDALTTNNPLNASGQAARIFRLPGQPAVNARELGPRTLAQVPPLELAHVLALAAEGTDDLPQTELYRRALAMLGRKSLTDASRAQLDRALPLVER